MYSQPHEKTCEGDDMMNISGKVDFNKELKETSKNGTWEGLVPSFSLTIIIVFTVMIVSLDIMIVINFTTVQLYMYMYISHTCTCKSATAQL